MTTKKERAYALQRMSKAELVKTIVALDSRQTKLLNEIAALKAEDLRAKFGDVDPGRLFPWEQK